MAVVPARHGRGARIALGLTALLTLAGPPERAAAPGLDPSPGLRHDVTIFIDLPGPATRVEALRRFPAVLGARLSRALHVDN